MKSILLSAIVTIMLLLSSCSETSSPSKSTIEFRSGISSNNVTASVNPKSDEIQSGIMEIRIDTVRILLNEIKIKLNGEDQKVRTGPAVYTITPDAKSVEFASAELPSGNVEQIKFEFHRFSSSELSIYQNNQTFKDFATEDRHSIIISGIKKIGDVEIPFQYKSKVTANLTFNFSPPFKIEEDKSNLVEFIFRTELVFKKSGSLIDPDDPKNFNEIDNLLRDAIKANKK